MSGAPVTDTTFVDRYETEWQILMERQCNVLLEGNAAATEAALGALQPYIGDPVLWHRPPAPLDRPAADTRALFLVDADQLSVEDQRRLLEWTGARGWRMQIITTASTPLFALVIAGLFDPTLYYRLNALRLNLRPSVSGLMAGPRR